MEECIHGLGPVSACTICNGADKKLKQEQASEWRTFPAKYEGICGECRGSINIGDDISWLEGEPVVHAGCLF